MENFQQINLAEGKISSQYFFKIDRCIYSCYLTRGDTKYLKCIESKCNSNAKIINNQLKRTNQIDHNHENDHQSRADYEFAYEKLRSAVKSDRRTVKQLHKEALRGLTREAAALLEWKRCRRTLQRIRMAQMPSCSKLEDLESLLEDDKSKVYKSYGLFRGERFYQGSVEGQLVFANMEMIGELSEVVDILTDATFKVLPFLARQLLVILAELQGRPRPILYAVMTGQTTHHYQVIFEFLRDGILSHDGTFRTVRYATTDFEQSLRLALINVWPDCQRVGCNFHFCQSIRRKARSMETLSTKLTDSSTHHKILIYFMRLSLLPKAKIDNGHAAIINFIQETDLFEDFEEFIEYFHSTWMVRYSKDSWCVSDRDRRTNNHVEGYNNKIKHMIPINPSPWIFLDAILDLAYDASSSFDSDRLRNAPPPPDRSILSVPLDAALQELNEGGINEFTFLERMSSV